MEVSPLDIKPRDYYQHMPVQPKRSKLEQRLIDRVLSDPDFAGLLADQANIDLERAMGLHTKYINSIYERGLAEKKRSSLAKFI